MPRLNHPDTLLSEIRDLRRRLQLLEAGRPPRQSMVAPTSPASSFLPVRPEDWPGTGSGYWEALLSAEFPAATAIEVTVAPGPGTEGEARVLLDGTVTGAPVPAGKHRLLLPAGGRVTVEARRIRGEGLVRVMAARED
ncbi:hypothetical protein [Longispora albida]|uniref:hypothetical protein n=1 Tax=Longispora albida TaxID=203523 RepID=UPI00036A0568|nr:hypothetical protein [Longispora albida]